MKEVFLAFAKANQEADKAFLAILNKMSNDDREKNRKSHFGSLSSLIMHITGGACYFFKMFAETAVNNPAALKALAPVAKLELPKAKKLTEDDWKKATSCMKAVDKAYVDFVAALTEEDFSLQVKLDWYKGKPATVPLYFMLQQLVSHGTHHRGQISQILDTLKIENDYSGINVKFL
jgi:uncharacterized damage-inducible protein DinB